MTLLWLSTIYRSLPRVDGETTAFDEWIRKVAFLSLPMPSGLLAPGYVPKTSSLNHRREQHFWCEFIQKSHRKMHVGQCWNIKDSSWCGRREDGRNVFTIRQHGEVHTVDALVAQFTALFAQGRLDIISTNTLYLTLKNVLSHRPSSETHDSSVILFFV